jgi:hypothetical protein
VTTFAPHQDRTRRLAELDAGVRSAWSDYRDDLRGLAPGEYDEREPAAWDRLQARLRELDEARTRLSGASVSQDRPLG